MSQEAETVQVMTRFNASYKYAFFVFRGLRSVNKHASVINFVMFIYFDSEGGSEALAHCSVFDIPLFIIIDHLFVISLSFRTNTLKVAYLRVLVIMLIGAVCLFRGSDLLIITLTQFLVYFCLVAVSENSINRRS